MSHNHLLLGDVDSLIEALQLINTDLQLVQLIDSSSCSETKQFMYSLRQYVGSKTTLDDNCQTAVVFYKFRKLCPTCQELLDLLKTVEEFGQTDIVERIKSLLRGWLLTLLSKRIIVDATEIDDRILRTQMLLADTLDYCLDADPAATSSFCLKLIKELEKEQETTWDKMYQTLMKFVLNELSLDLDEMSVNEINRKQILFILHHVSDVSAAQLDVLLQWSVKNGDEEITSSVQQVFAGRHWNPKWNTLRSIGPKEELNRIEAALTWEYCRLFSYKQKMQLCSSLEEKLRSNPKEIREWVEKEETEIIGSPFEDVNHLKSSFFDFFRQLSNEITISKKSANQEMLVESIIQQKIRRSLYIYDRVQFDSTAEIKELYQLLQDADNEIKQMSPNTKEDWSDLKTKHKKKWTANYIRSWTEKHQTLVKEIAQIKMDIQDNWQPSSRIFVKILLSKYLCFTSKNLSPLQSLAEWKSLAEMKINEPEKLRQEIQKRIADAQSDGIMNLLGSILLLFGCIVFPSLQENPLVMLLK